MQRRWVGKGIPSIVAAEKVTGKMVFGTDFALPGMLYGKVLRSTVPHARIKRIDTTKAERLLGVKAVITGADCPEHKYTVAGQPVADMTILAREKVYYVGDEVAAVAAISEDIAEEALELIEVEYEELPAVFDPEEAMKEGAPILHEELGSNIASHLDFVRGDPDEGFASSDAIVEGHFETQMVHQCYLEPHGAVAAWSGSGKLTMWIPTQSATLCRMTYAKALGLDPKDVRIIQLPLGGAFGGKLEYKLHPIVALLAKKAGAPVKLVNSRRDEFLAGTPRVPMKFYVRLGGKKDGTFTAKEMRIIAGNGAYTYYAPPILVSAATRHDCLYRIKNIRTKAWAVYTNQPATSCFRGFGNPQSHFAFESTIDMLAHELGIDPLEIRLRNASQSGDVTAHGWKMYSVGLTDCLKKSAEALGWEEKKKNKKPYRGVGIASCLHVSGNRSFLPFFDGSGAMVRVDGDCHVTVYSGEPDVGQGLRTTFAQIAAEELGIPPWDIEVALVDTEISPHGLGTYADRATTLGGNAVRIAAMDAKRQLRETAAQILGIAAGEISFGDGMFYSSDDPERKVSLAETARKASYLRGGAPIVGHGTFIPPDVVMIDPKTKYGNISCAYPFAVHAVEVEVDPETGNVKVLKFAAAHDLGYAINPLASEGQIEGGGTQGIGYALREELVTGSLGTENASFRAYEIPRASEMPEFVPILVESNDPNGPYGAKGLGEPALNATAAAIANAIFDAVGIRVTRIPVTPERMLNLLNEKLKTEGKPLSSG
ncbi:MAG TPA: xanthine dehydrogenase family protein molybdopterin-binding subunit [Clostridia bacterium]|nr:xanthine dehydrogenase family protein molybdopterin-binding subunit [Clostridia bacterium]